MVKCNVAGVSEIGRVRGKDLQSLFISAMPWRQKLATIITVYPPFRGRFAGDL